MTSLKLNKVFIIAEAGVNHNGSIELAKKMIDAAKESCVDAVKFQTFKAERVVSKKAEKAQYQKDATNESESQLEMLKKLELDVEAHKELIAYCEKKSIMFLSTPFDHDSIDMLHDLGLEIFKIPSGEITNLPYLRHIGSLGKKVVLSTGMSNLKEVGNALNILINAGTSKDNITVLHANTMYPTPMEDVNLNAMLTIQKEFDVAVGYSDHTLGIEVDIAAVAMGASCIEKHFTLDKTMKGWDHKISATPEEMRIIAENSKRIFDALGRTRINQMESEEQKNAFRRSIIATKEIREGEVITEEMLTSKRPGTGIPPGDVKYILGKKAKRNISHDEIINIADF